MINRKEVYDAIDSERKYQDLTWGNKRRETVGEYVLYMQAYMNELIHEIAHGKDEDGLPCSKDTLHRLRKVIALGVLCLENFGAPKRELPHKGEEPEVIWSQK